jgi:hypothetical protein
MLYILISTIICVIGSLFYFVIIILTITTSIVIQVYYADSIKISRWNIGCEDIEYHSVCVATTSVMRFSISLVVLLGLEMLGTFIHAAYFDLFLIFKFVGYVALVLGSFYATSLDMLNYAWFARFVAFIFLIYQQIILIDFAYNWNATWVQKSDASENYSWLYALMITSNVFLIN